MGPGRDRAAAGCGRAQAPAGIESFARELFAAIPDYRLDVIDLIGSQDLVIGRFRAEGTFEGEPLFGFRATGKAWRAEGVDVIRFDAGLIVELDVYSDPIATARVAGIIPDHPAIDFMAAAALNLSARVRRLL